jgi:hypothetical protein
MKLDEEKVRRQSKLEKLKDQRSLTKPKQMFIRKIPFMEPKETKRKIISIN